MTTLAPGFSVRWSRFSRKHLLFDHPTPAGRHCSGVIEFNRHRLISRKPLTIEPSIMCPTCGNHGFIQEGKWVPADKYAELRP